MKEKLQMNKFEKKKKKKKKKKRKGCEMKFLLNKIH